MSYFGKRMNSASEILDSSPPRVKNAALLLSSGLKLSKDLRTLF
jgi:hypothetical protein